MDNHYLILLSLFLVGLIGFVAVVTDGTVVNQSEINDELRLAIAAGTLYDSGGHAVCYYNLTAVGEAGQVVYVGVRGVAYWHNASLSNYQVYLDVEGQSPLDRGDFDEGGLRSSEYMRGFSGTSDGFVGSIFANMLAGSFVAIVVGTLAFVALVSVNVFGSGVGEFGVRSIATIGFYSLLWVLVSAVGVVSLTSIPFFGWVFYLLLSFAYYLGVWGEINN